MKTNPDTKRVLFYGDSLVFGKTSGSNERLDGKTRFTGVLQDLLGDRWEVLEEGLRGRTLYGENGFFPERNGLEQFGPIIGSHLPIDVLVLFLGTNNANSRANTDNQGVLDAYTSYLQKLVSWAEFLAVAQPKVFVVIPPVIDSSHYDQGSEQVFGLDAQQSMEQIAGYILNAATQLGLQVLDTRQVCEPAIGDGIHLDAKGNSKLARAVESILDKLHE